MFQFLEHLILNVSNRQDVNVSTDLGGELEYPPLHPGLQLAGGGLQLLHGGHPALAPPGGAPALGVILSFWTENIARFLSWLAVTLSPEVS